MPTGTNITRAALQVNISAVIKNNPATLIRGDVLAQQLLDQAESSIFKGDYANNSIVYKNSSGVMASLTVGTDRIVGRKSSGEIVALTAAEVITILGIGAPMTNPMTTLGDIIYGAGSGVATRLAGNITATKKFLRQTGNGAISAAPAWDTVTATDVGLGNVEDTALSTWGGSGSIVQVGTVGNGTWQSDVIEPQYGGTGVNNGTKTIALTSNSITIDSDNVSNVLTVSGNTSVSGTNTGDQDLSAYALNGANNDITSIQLDNTGLQVRGTSGANRLTIKPNEVLSAPRTLSIVTGDADRSLTLTGNASISGTHSGTSSGTNTGDQTTVSGNAGTATALQNARTIGGVSFDGTANITVASATGGFTISGGNLALGTNSITMSGSIGVTGTRVTKGWFTDLEVTNAIVGSITGSAPAGSLTGTTLSATVVTSSLTTVGTLVNLTVTNPITGSITGNAATVTTNANLTGDVTSSGNATTIGANKVLLTMVADIATRSVMGRNTAGTGDPEVLTNFAIGILIHATGGGNVIAASTTTYGEFAFGNSLSTTETSRQITVPFACVIKNFYIRTQTAQPASGAMVVTMRLNAGATTVTINIPLSSGAGTFSDTTHSFVVAAGDRVAIEFANAATGNSANILEVTCGMFF